MNYYTHRGLNSNSYMMVIADKEKDAIKLVRSYLDAYGFPGEHVNIKKEEPYFIGNASVLFYTDDLQYAIKNL